jgi:F-type H+-transporting ATPase subunit b
MPASIFLLPNATFFVELAVFLLLVFVFVKWAVPPINRVVAERQELIRSSLEAADRAKKDAEAADDVRHQLLDDARGQARDIVSTAQQTADSVRSKAATDAQVEFDRIVAAAAVEVQAARQRAVDEAASRLGEVVLEVVTKIVGREIDAESHRELINEAIAALDVESTNGAGPPR